MSTIGVAIIGSGAIALANHVPALGFCPQARLAALCDSDPAVLDRARRQTGVTVASPRYQDIIARDDVQAVIIATPNCTHAPIALAAIAAGKHVLCEKPIAMNFAEAMQMYRAAEAARVRHMTAFTYRFVPSMVYMADLVRRGVLGRPYHFRAQRFQDWGDRPVGWRQVEKLAGSGELGDMLSHRIDFGHLLVGPIVRLVSRMARFIENRRGQVSEVDDWVAILADFHNGATGVLESTKLATGHGEGARSHDYCEVNGESASLVYRLAFPREVLIQRAGSNGLQQLPVPAEFLKHPASARDPGTGDPLVTFRYDQDAEFIDAIVNGRECRPSFLDGAMAQAVMDAALQSNREQRWVDVARAE